MPDVEQNTRFGIYMKCDKNPKLWMLVNGASYMTRRAAYADLEYWRALDKTKQWSNTYKVLERNAGNLSSFIEEN